MTKQLERTFRLASAARLPDWYGELLYWIQQCKHRKKLPLSRHHMLSTHFLPRNRTISSFTLSTMTFLEVLLIEKHHNVLLVDKHHNVLLEVLLVDKITRNNNKVYCCWCVVVRCVVCWQTPTTTTYVDVGRVLWLQRPPTIKPKCSCRICYWFQNGTNIMRCCCWKSYLVENTSKTTLCVVIVDWEDPQQHYMLLLLIGKTSNNIIYCYCWLGRPPTTLYVVIVDWEDLKQHYILLLSIGKTSNNIICCYCWLGRPPTTLCVCCHMWTTVVLQLYCVLTPLLYVRTLIWVRNDLSS